MSDPFFPQLQEASLLQLRVVLQQMARTPGYLSHPKCPYPAAVVDLLKDLDKPAVAAAVPAPSFETEDEKLDYLEAEIVAVLTDLTALVAGLGAADHSEKLQVAKARAGLVEKLGNLREKVWSMKNQAAFQAQIMSFLEQSCSKDQIEELKQHLRSLRSVA